MKFGPVPVEEAEGAILAHSIGLPDGKLKKGIRLGPEAVERLAAAGHAEVTVARLGADDLHEDAAAARFAAALVPDPVAQGVSVSAPFTGRVNVYAEAPGVVAVDPDLLTALNSLDEGLTVATLPNLASVAARQMVATIKIIPYGLALRSLVAAETLLAGQAGLALHPRRLKTAALVLTRTPGMAEKLVQKGGNAVRQRLTVLGIDLVSEVVVAHRTGPAAEALAGLDADILLLLTGSATSDRADVGPSAVAQAGGEIRRYGIPVDPGNLLFLGTLSGRPVVGLPGCARSPKLNGADWVLQRLVSGLTIGPADFATMGVGGLLKEIPSRPVPRGAPPLGDAAHPRRAFVSALVLAAGSARRMQGRDKLLETVDGAPLIARLAGTLAKSGADETVVVLREDDAAREAALQGAEVRRVTNPRAAEGMGTSIAAGLAALDPRAEAAVILLADMPEIAAEDVDRLIAAFDPEEGREIVRATSAEGEPGHPVLFGRRFFEVLAGLGGDRGAKEVVREHREFLVDVPLPGRRALVDLDTQADWETWRRGKG